MSLHVTEPPETTVRPLHAITARRSMPSARALIGALLVTLAALGAFGLATSGYDGPSTSYLVLDRDVAVGEPLSPDAVRLEPLELSEQLAGASLTGTEGLDGATALRDLRAGELLSRHDLIAAPLVDGEPQASIHELAFAIPLERTPAGLVRGDRVTVLGTLGERTYVAVEDAVVLSVDSEPEHLRAGGLGVMTLAVPDARTVLEIAHATQTAELTIVRSTRAIDDVFPESTQTAWRLEPAESGFAGSVESVESAVFAEAVEAAEFTETAEDAETGEPAGPVERQTAGGQSHDESEQGR